MEDVSTNTCSFTVLPVYQYVGDEIVVTWPETEGIKNHFCIDFYFAYKKQFQDRTAYYMTNYGFLPDFKAGMHTGTVTTVEIGEVKEILPITAIP